MERAIDASELMAEIQVCSWDSEQDMERAEDLVLGMPTLTPPNEWVSVNKRLPEKRKDVLVHYGNGRIGIDWIDSTQCFVFDELYGRVTHWLPIPELPGCRPPEGDADG